MFKDMDAQALWNSEVFQNYINLENAREIERTQQESIISKNTLMNLERFQHRVNASPVLKNTFKKLQHRFINDPDYRMSVNQDFVQGVLLLKFED